VSSSGDEFARDSVALRYVVEAAEAATVEALEGLFREVPIRVERGTVATEGPPDSSIASVITLSGLAFCPLTLYLCLTVAPDHKREASV